MQGIGALDKDVEAASFLLVVISFLLGPLVPVRVKVQRTHQTCMSPGTCEAKGEL